MRDLFIIGGLLLLWYELQPAAPAAPALNILTAGPNVPVQGMSIAQIQYYLDVDAILPDEAEALISAGEGLPAEPHALANGLAKINAWLKALGAA